MSDSDGPSVDSWTLKFKHSKSVIYLHSEPSTTFPTLKQDLLAALSELPAESSVIKALPELPTDPDHIVFAILVDKLDLEQGWVALDIPETEVEDGPDGEIRTVGGPSSIVNRDPKSAGLRDGSQIAFRFLTNAEIRTGDVDTDGKLWEVELPEVEEENHEESET